MLQTCTDLSGTGVWLRILKYAIKHVLVVSTLVLGASVNHSHSDDMAKHYLPFIPIRTVKISYTAPLGDAAFYFYLSHSPW